jgi:hypothetical protein
MHERRYFYLNRVHAAGVPPHNLSFFPDGMTVRKLADSGVYLIDGFCTPAEASAIVEFARDKVKPAQVIQNNKMVLAEGRESETVRVFGPNADDPQFLPIAIRAAALTGLPYTHLEGVYVTRYGEGGHYNEHVDYGDDFRVDRLYTVLLYLNDMAPNEGGATAFPALNVQVRPRTGRAVSWTNKNPDGSAHLETSHAALPVTNGGEKWTIQFWFHAYRMFDEMDVMPPQVRRGEPVTADADFPEGVSFFERSGSS